LIKKLFGREDLALLGSFLATINPLYVFFTHNIQMIIPGLFFTLLGSYLYVVWLNDFEDSSKFKYLYLATFFITLGTMTKYSFAVIIFPILFTFPFKKIFEERKKYVVPVVISLLIASLFFMWYFYTESYIRPKLIGEAGKQLFSRASKVKLGIVFTSEFWVIMKNYVSDNFSLTGIWFSIFGMITFMGMFVNKKLKGEINQNYKFMLGYLVGMFFFFFIMGFKMSGHNYHQYPLAPAIIFFIAYLTIIISNTLASLIPNKTTKYVAVFSLIVLLVFVLPVPGLSIYSKSMEAKERMFNTQFPGLDIAGEYIHTHSLPSERIFHSSGQNYGVLWHADRVGYKPPRDVEYFKRAEEEYNVSWVFVYQGLNIQQRWGFVNYCFFVPVELCNQEKLGVSQYIRDNYHLAQMAFLVNNQQAQPIYLLFNKGGHFNISTLDSMIAEQQQLVKTYYMIQDGEHQPYQIRYVNFE